MKVTVEASPSLALAKYWGKLDAVRNIPATSSLAVTLAGLRSRTTVESGADGDRIAVNGVDTPVGTRAASVFARVRELSGYSGGFSVRSANNFATSAGLASSSSGFAALAAGCVRAAGADLTDRECSAIARLGSASAARSIYGGFTVLREGEEAAEQVRDEDYWPDLAIVVCTVSVREKGVPSGEAMELSRLTSPYYRSWLGDARVLFREAVDALAAKDLQRLGEAARRSYLRMHAVMMASSPPVLYIEPASLEIVRLCGGLRASGVGAWETMDAGPQVKILCSARDAATVAAAIARDLPAVSAVVTGIGAGVRGSAGEVE